MNIRKLPSGKWQIRETRKGHTYSLVVDTEPGKREAKKLIEQKIISYVELLGDFEEAADKYINAKVNVLSPSTIKAYDAMNRNIPSWFKRKDITEIDNYAMQRLVNELSEKHSPKYVTNIYGFCTAVIRFFIPDTKVSATTPKKPRTDAYIPTVDDCKRLFEEAKGTEYYVALRLASMSLRRSEILALTLDDLDGDYLTINKAMVQNKDKEWVIKPTPKTEMSNRTIALPHDLTEYIRQQGYIYHCTPNGIDSYLRRTLKRLGIPQFSLHKLRHFFASYGHSLGYSDQLLQELGGWETSSVFERVYRHAMKKDEAKIQVANDFNI